MGDNWNWYIQSPEGTSQDGLCILKKDLISRVWVHDYLGRGYFYDRKKNLSHRAERPIPLKFSTGRALLGSYLKGKFPQTTMWIGWVESNFTNPTVNVWTDLDNPFKRSDYAKLCMSPSLDGTQPEYVISQEDNSPLTLYIDFQNVQIFLDINSPFDPVHS